MTSVYINAPLSETPPLGPAVPDCLSHGLLAAHSLIPCPGASQEEGPAPAGGRRSTAEAPSRAEMFCEGSRATFCISSEPRFPCGLSEAALCTASVQRPTSLSSASLCPGPHPQLPPVPQRPRASLARSNFSEHHPPNPVRHSESLSPGMSRLWSEGQNPVAPACHLPAQQPWRTHKMQPPATAPPPPRPEAAPGPHANSLTALHERSPLYLPSAQGQE